jgi:hypothetical protein
MLTHLLRARRVALAAALAVSVAGCSRDDAPANARPGITLLSPPSPTATVPAAAVGIEVRTSGVDELVLQDGAGNELGRRSVQGSRTVLGPVALMPGVNELRLLGTRAGSLMDTVPLSLTSAVDPAIRVAWTVEPRIAEGAPAEVTFTVAATLAQPAKEILVDADGDGRFETRRNRTTTASTTLPAEGTFAPVVLVHTADDFLLPQTVARVQSLRVVPPTALDPALTFASPVAAPTDLEYQPSTGLLFVLAAQSRTVLVFQANRALQRTVSLATTTEPAGICVSDEGDLLVADRGSHRIFRYKAPGFALDPLLGTSGAFGSRGSGPGQFESPEDVAVEGVGFEQRVFVCDRGNRRIVRCNRAGLFDGAFDGSDGGVVFEAPRSVTSLPTGGIAVLDRQHARAMTSDGRTEATFGTFVDAIRLCRDWRQSQLVVTDVGRRIVSLHAPAGTLVREVRVDGAVSCGITLPIAGGDHVVVGNRGAGRIQAGRLLDEPLADSPSAVLQRFLATIVSDDFATARTLVDEDARAAFDTASGNPTERGRVRADATALGTPLLIATSPTLAHLRATRATGSGQAVADFTLRRDVRAGAWRLFEF